MFHNHTGEHSFRYSYPLIQYKRLGRKAAIVCVEDGVDVIGQFLSEVNGMLILGNREATCNLSKVSPTKILVQTWNNSFRYQLSHWLPLNPKNYARYQMTNGLTERIELLERILTANLLSMLKGLGIFLESELIVKITWISDSYLLYNKGVGMTAFDAEFTSNLSIPNNLGIGKNASIGYGVIHQIKSDKQEESQNAQ